MEPISAWYPVNANQEARLERIRKSRGTGSDWFVHNQLIPVGFQINGPIDVDRLTQAVERVAARHTAFRTVFDWSSTPARQCVVAELPRLDVLGKVDDDDYRDRVIMAPMDLKTGPLARFLLLERDGHSEFWICVEHLVADGWSLDVITREIQEAYADPSHLWQPVAIQNHRYGVFESHYCESDTGRRAKAFWERRLAGRSPWLALDYPGAGSVAQLNESSALWEQIRLDIGQARLARASRAGRLTPYVMLLSSMCRAVSRRGGLSAVPVMSPIANRGPAELESTVTWCSNIMPCAIEMDPAAGQLDEFRSVRNQLAEFASFASYPIHRLMRELVPHLWGLARPTVPFLYFDVEMPSSEFSLGVTAAEHLTPPIAPIVRGLVTWCRVDEEGLDLQFGCGEGFLPAAELRSLVDETAEELAKAVAVLT